MIKCSVDGCERASRAGGMCQSHYMKMRRYGTTDGKERWPDHIVRQRQWIDGHLNHESDDCLIWPYALTRQGRGQINTVIGDVRVRLSPSVLMLTLTQGDAPAPNLDCAHSCGNGHLGCVNPKHLRWATHRENMADMMAHGRGIAKTWKSGIFLTDEDRAAIKAAKEPMRKTAQRFDISASLVHRIVHS